MPSHAGKIPVTALAATAGEAWPAGGRNAERDYQKYRALSDVLRGKVLSPMR